MSFLYLFYVLPAVQAALIPQFLAQTSFLSIGFLQPGLTSGGSVLEQVNPTSSALLLAALPSASSVVNLNLPISSLVRQLPTSSNMLRPALVTVSSILNQVLPTSSGLLQPAFDTVYSSLNVNMPNSSGLLQPPLNSVSSVVNQALPTSSRLIPPALRSNSLPISSALAQPALDNVCNGFNIAFPSSFVSFQPVLESVASNANQILPTISGLLQAAVMSIKANVNQALPTSSALQLAGAPSLLSSVSPIIPASCIDVFSIASLASGSLHTTLITLQPACSPLSVYVSNLQLSSGLASALNQLPTSISLAGALATVASKKETSALSFSSPTATSGSPPLPCITQNSLNPRAPVCSLIPGSVVPFKGLLPCETCPTNTGPLGIDLCPWLCSISFLDAGIHICSPIDITGHPFPDSSGALTGAYSLAVVVCRPCAAPCNAVTSSAAMVAPTKVAASSAALVSIAALVPGTTASIGPSCTNLPFSASPPCCEPYANQGNLVCTSCPVSSTELAYCPWLCRMPYRRGRIDFECSPIDLTGADLFSPYNETVQCGRCLPACSSSPSALVSTSSSFCALSTTVAPPLTSTAVLPLTAATNVAAAAPTCTNIARGAPLVTCKGGPDFSTLFCPHGCPTDFTDQCTFLCMSTSGSAFGGLFPAIQCAPVDLSLISPGIVSCQQCFPQCNSNSTGSPASLDAGASPETNDSITVTKGKHCGLSLFILELRFHSSSYFNSSTVSDMQGRKPNCRRLARFARHQYRTSVPIVMWLQCSYCCSMSLPL